MCEFIPWDAQCEGPPSSFSRRFLRGACRGGEMSKKSWCLQLEPKTLNPKRAIFFAVSIAIFVSFYRAISSFVLSRDVSEIHSSVCGCERFLKEVPAKMKTSRFST